MRRERGGEREEERGGEVILHCGTSTGELHSSSCNHVQNKKTRALTSTEP